MVQSINHTDDAMTIKECYEAFGGNYDDVLSRFRSEARIEKYIYKFLADGSFQVLQTSLENGHTEDAFRAAHTLKGVAENLGFTRLSKSSHQMTEALRKGDSLEAAPYIPQVYEDYNLTITAIRKYQTTAGSEI